MSKGQGTRWTAAVSGIEPRDGGGWRLRVVVWDAEDGKPHTTRIPVSKKQAQAWGSLIGEDATLALFVGDPLEADEKGQ